MSDSEKTKIPINNFMTRNIKSIQSNTSVKDASKIMYESHIPSLVVQDSEDVIGIVTYEDISIALAIYENKPETEIKEIMSSPVISVKSDASILDAVELMLAKKNSQTSCHR